MNALPLVRLSLAAAICAAALVSLSAANTAPKLLTQAAPAYPFELRSNNQEGAVLVHFHITPAGVTKEVTVVSSTDPAFEQPALDAVRQWTYTPARRDGQAVDSPAIQLVTFRVADKEGSLVTSALANRLQPRYGRPNGVPHLINSADPCFCGGDRSYNDCHGRNHGI